MKEALVVAILKENGIKVTDADLLNTFFPRFRGLALRRRRNVSKPVVLYPCSKIHTFFMRFPVDLYFISDRGSVTRVLRGVPPKRVIMQDSSSVAVIESPSGLIQIQKDSQIIIPGLIENKV